MITGNDEVSLKILKEYSNGKSNAEIVIEFGLSTDQAKKLSRLYSMFQQINELPESLQEKLKNLGLKALVLSPLVKKKDIEGLQDILQSIDMRIKRDTLTKMLPALEEKRKHIEESKQEINYQMRRLERKQEEVNHKIQELHETELKINEIFGFLENASTEARDFLMEHLGVKDGEIVLAKRLYYNWQQELKHDDIIEYDWVSYSWKVQSIDRLIAATEKKLSNKRSRSCMWFDEEKDPWNFSAEYKKVSSAQVNLVKMFKYNKKELRALDKEKKALLKSIEDIKSKSAMSYMEAAILANEISSKDIETHALLQGQGMKWLYDQGYACAPELSHVSYRFDVA